MVIAVIPARSGSKAIKDKNILPFNGKPLIAYSIQHALESNTIDRVIVSTDSEEYAKIAVEYGAEVPFLRPKDISGDFSTDLELFLHTLNWLRNNEGNIPEICVHLRPTYPTRLVSDIDSMVTLLKSNKNIDSIRCVTLSKETPYKMWFFDKENKIIPVIDDGKESFNMPRQQLRKAYIQTASIDVVFSKVILEQNSMSGKNILGYEVSEIFDIDTIEDFKRAEEFSALNKK